MGLICLVTLSAAGCAPRSIDLNDKSEYTHIRAFDGHLNPVDGLVHVDVYVLDHRPVGDFDRSITQNIIEVTSAAGTRRHRRPEPFTAGWCEIVDLDGDGWREFAFINLVTARVVSFREGPFVFQTDRDQLRATVPIRLLDKNNDGRRPLARRPQMRHVSRHRQRR